MSKARQHEGPVAAVFDLNQPASCVALADVVGVENLPRIIERAKPFVVLILEGPEGESAHLAFEDESQFLHFYLSTLRVNATLEQRRRIQFVLRDLAPAFEETLRQATRDLAQVTGAPAGGVVGAH